MGGGVGRFALRFEPAWQVNKQQARRCAPTPRPRSHLTRSLRVQAGSYLLARLRCGLRIRSFACKTLSGDVRRELSCSAAGFLRTCIAIPSLNMRPSSPQFDRVAGFVPCQRDVEDVRAVLERELHTRSSLTVGDVLDIDFCGTLYRLRVLELQPQPQVRGRLTGARARGLMDCVKPVESRASCGAWRSYDPDRRPRMGLLGICSCSSNMLG